MVRDQARQQEGAGNHRRRPEWFAAIRESTDYLEAGDDNRKLCSLYLGIMVRMGVHLDRFGDAQSRLVGFGQACFWLYGSERFTHPLLTGP